MRMMKSPWDPNETVICNGCRHEVKLTYMGGGEYRCNCCWQIHGSNDLEALQELKKKVKSHQASVDALYNIGGKHVPATR